MSSPKRRNDDLTGADETSAKRSRVDRIETDSSSAYAAPDSLIDHAAAIAYWSSQEPTNAGVLGGLPQVSRVDLQGSANFLARLRRQSRAFPIERGKLKCAVDCGAGIGRITKGFLSKVAESVDIVEPVKSFSDQVKGEACIRNIYNVGLENWNPEGLGPYDLIWIQWCLNQLTDAQVVAFLKRLPPALSNGGWIVVKENSTSDHQEEDIFDATDNSVTRTDVKHRSLFEEAGLKIISTEVQKGMPKGLYPVRTYALLLR